MLVNSIEMDCFGLPVCPSRQLVLRARSPNAKRIDRIKDLIKVRGFQVAPAELESILLSHDRVQDCAVKRAIGEATELPVAFVVVESNLRTIEMGKILQDFVASKVAYYKRLEGGVIFVESIPKKFVLLAAFKQCPVS